SPSPLLPISDSRIDPNERWLGLRATAPLPPRGIDRVAFAMPEVDADSALLQNFAECALGVVGGCFVRQPGDRVVRNHVEHRRAAVEESYQLGRCAWAVVEAT